MRRLIWIVAPLLATSSALADTQPPSVAVANDLYQHGNYAQSADEFQKLVDSGIITADMYFNLGTADLKAGRRGAAMLAFERALRIDPSDADAAFNLTEAQKGNIDKIVGTSEEEPLLERLGTRIPVEPLGYAFLILWLAGNAGLMIRWFRGSRAELIGLGGGVATGVAVLVAPLLLLGAWQRGHSPYALVVSPQTSVREGPASDFKSAFEIHEGLKVRIVGEEKGFLRIRLPNGIEGWVSEKDAPVI